VKTSCSETFHGHKYIKLTKNNKINMAMEEKKGVRVELEGNGHVGGTYPVLRFHGVFWGCVVQCRGAGRLGVRGWWVA
jgi:hypothetical protein